MDNTAAMLTSLLIGSQTDRCSIPSRGKKCISSLKPSDRLWSPPCLLFNAHPGLFLQGQNGRGLKLTTHTLSSAAVKNHSTIFPLRFSLRGAAQGQIYIRNNSDSGVMGCATDCALDIWEEQGVSFHCCISTGSVVRRAS